MRNKSGAYPMRIQASIRSRSSCAVLIVISAISDGQRWNVALAQRMSECPRIQSSGIHGSRIDIAGSLEFSTSLLLRFGSDSPAQRVEVQDSEYQRTAHPSRKYPVI